MILKDDPNLFVFIRKLDNETIIVIGSFSLVHQTFDTTHYPIGDVLIQNYEDIAIDNNTLNLRPYESISYKVKE